MAPLGHPHPAALLLPLSVTSWAGYPWLWGAQGGVEWQALPLTLCAACSCCAGAGMGWDDRSTSTLWVYEGLTLQNHSLASANTNFT